MAAYSRGQIDPKTFGVDPVAPVYLGPWLLFNEVIIEIARWFGDELLPRDRWARAGAPDAIVAEKDAAWLDPVAEPIAATDENSGVEEQALERYLTDDGLHPHHGHPSVPVRRTLADC